MGRSLDVLDMVTFLVFDASVAQLALRDGVHCGGDFAGDRRVPHNSAHVLHASHLLVSQIGEDFEHVTAVAILTEDVIVDEHL